MRFSMKILKINHLGIAVNNINEGKKFWTDVLGLEFEGAETVEEQKVTTAFFPVGESEIELLESTSPDGPVAKFIEKKGAGFQHVAFQVEDIVAALAELKEKSAISSETNSMISTSFSEYSLSIKCHELGPEEQR